MRYNWRGRGGLWCGVKRRVACCGGLVLLGTESPSVSVCVSCEKIVVSGQGWEVSLELTVSFLSSA